jgi:hypothetical protein
VTLYPEKQQLRGSDLLKLHPLGSKEVVLTLAPNAHVSSVSLAQNALPYTFKDGELKISLKKEQRHGEIDLRVSYEAFFKDPVPANPIRTEDPSYGVTGVISVQGTFLLAGAGWYPNLAGSQSTFRLRVQAPLGYEAVTAGKPLERRSDSSTTTSVWEAMHARGGLALSAGPYVVRTADADGIPVYSYFFKEDDHLAESYLRATAGYLSLYRELIGPYPFHKFAVVENFFPTGYGFPSYTLLGSTVIRLPFIVETSLGHEVAHAWWGNGVLVDYEAGNWSEGLTSYVADHLYQERLSAEAARAYRLKILRDYTTLVSPAEDFPLKAFISRVNPSSRTVGYGKAAMIFHMARHYLGDDAFWSSLQDVFREKLFQRASWHDFAVTMSRVGGHDLKPFFEQWVKRPGGPILALHDAQARREDGQWEVSACLRQGAPYYDLRVPVRLETDTVDLDTMVSLNGESVTLSFRTKTPPKRLIVDPEVDLFRRLDASEVPPVINSLKGSRSLLAVAARSLPAETLEAARIVLTALGQEGASLIFDDEVVPSGYQDHDVLFIGFPTGKNLPSFPDDLIVSRDRFVLGGTTYHTPDDALFVVLPHMQNPGRVMGLFLPLSPEAAMNAVRKISHYGKYSYLVFRRGVNQEKGTWPVNSSPLVHEFELKEVSS